MDPIFEVTRLLSSAAFLFFGLACLVSRHMIEEFRRYGLAPYRVPVGLLEMSGAVGLALASTFPALLLPAAAGLALLMILGLLTRLRIRDSLMQMLPAVVLLLMNGFLVLRALGTAAPAGPAG
ncbi:MAG: DoxX family protein [Planctomycetota bacterium]|jgi:hypothetical protein